VADAKLVHLSRSEVLELVFGKLHLIEAECQEMTDEDAVAWRPAKLADVQRRLKRIALEAKRAASIIETHTHAAKGGHCVYCGLSYEEHDTDEARRAKGEDVLPKQHAKDGSERPRCLALQRLFESVELETYQPLPMMEVDLGR
jgi:hypothetical protein